MRFTLYLFLMLAGLLAQGQTPALSYHAPLEPANPASVGMSPERLERLDTMLSETIAAGDLPGAVALVARHGKIVFHRAYGSANAGGEPLQKDHIFRIASQSKAITSTALMMLWEEAKCRLDEPLSTFIPAFANATVLDTMYEDGTFGVRPAKRPITIRHLLTHTSGLGYGVIDGDPRFKKIYADAGITDLFTTKPVTIKESVLKLAELPLHHDPGDAFTYSEGIDVAGYLIEVISGMPLDEFFRKRLLDPLGMDDTWFYLPREKHDRLVAVQQKNGNNWSDFPVTFYDPDYPRKGAGTFFSGGAGLSSTALDYATFLQMYLNGGAYGDKQLLSPITIDLILDMHDQGHLGGGRYHGLAFSVTNEEGVRTGTNGSLGTFSWGGYFNTQYFADPKTGIIGVLLKQTQGPVNDQTAWKFRQLITQAIVTR